MLCIDYADAESPPTDMSGKLDFLAFYELIGVQPDCKPEMLRSAYRHCVSELHPDRQRAGSDPRAADLLQEVNATYVAAMRFYRRYGRLPGTVAHVRTQASWTHAPAPTAAAPARAPVRVSRKALVFALMGAGLLVWLAANDDTISNAPSATGKLVQARIPVSNHDASRLPAIADRARGGTTDAWSHDAQAHIEVGMDEESVRALEGPPFMTSGDHWDYGPSWIDFEHGHVSNWYSSPLRRLHVGTARPPNKASE